MDVKKTIKILRDKTGEQDDEGITVMIYASGYIDEIANLIEQQAQQIEELEKADIHREICMVEMAQKIAEYEHDELGYVLTRYDEQAKYTELGRLAVEFLADKDYCSDACAISAFKDGVNDNCKECWVFKICQKRAEFLAEGCE